MSAFTEWTADYKILEGRFCALVIWQPSIRAAVAGYQGETFDKARKWQLSHYPQCAFLTGNLEARAELSRRGLPVNGAVRTLEQCRRLYGKDFVITPEKE